MSLALLFHYLLLNMFRILIHPSSGACDLFVELFHGLYCWFDVFWCYVVVWLGWCGIRMSGWSTIQISRKLLRMDVLTPETCLTLNNEIIKQVTSSWSLFIHYLLLNMFRMLIHPSSGACVLFDALLHGLYCSGSMCVGVTLWFGWGGVVAGWSTASVCIRIPHHNVTPKHIEPAIQPMK